MKTMNSILFVVLALITSTSYAQTPGKTKPVAAVLGLDSKGLTQDKIALVLRPLFFGKKFRITQSLFFYLK